MWGWLVLPGLFIWTSILLLPWRPWSTRESLDVNNVSMVNLKDVTVLIPARNEADVIGTTLSALAQQDPEIKIILIDDQSTDDTAGMAQAHDHGLVNLTIIHGETKPSGWSGKLWAVEQGRKLVETDNILLLDADIALKPGMLVSLLHKMETEDLQLVSLMANLRMHSTWEKLLMPAFIFFFKLLYPFHLANSSFKYVAAAAGGCILLKTQVLEEIGGFAALKGALIDDCTLAKLVKHNGHRTWIGLSHDAVSLRCYDMLNTIWEMVSRTAFTQLKHSISLLLLCTALMLCAFVLPVYFLFSENIVIFLTALLSTILMMFSYLPTLRYYNLSMAWALCLPIIGVLYLLMTWSSAINHWRGSGAIWKERSYS